VGHSADVENDTQLVLRVPKEMADRLKAHAERLADDYGVPVTTSAAMRKLLADALDVAEASKPKSRKRA
jgi:predicted DNA-binding protein